MQVFISKMADEIFFKIVFLVLLIFINLIRIYYHSASQSRKSYSQNKIKEKGAVILFYLSFGIPSIMYIFTDYFSISLPDLMRFFGIAIISFGTYFFWRTHNELGKNFSAILEIKEDHRLIQSGPYKRIRHPMYISLYISILGFFLLSSNLIVGLMPFIGFSILYLTRVRHEEEMMIKKFGKKYEEYMKITGRLFPKF